MSAKVVMAHYAHLLDCEPVNHSEDETPAVMIWLDVEGKTYKVTLSLDDAQELAGRLTESVEWFDSDDDLDDEFEV